MLRRTLVALALCTTLIAPTLLAEEWVGWITDEHCGAKGASGDHKGCALSCAGRGAKLVLFTPSDEKLYTLDNQDLAKEHVGHKVKVTGAKDGEGIKVEAIAAAEEKPAS